MPQLRFVDWRYQFEMYSVKRHSTLMGVTWWREILYPDHQHCLSALCQHSRKRTYSVSALKELVLFQHSRNEISLQVGSFRILKTILFVDTVVKKLTIFLEGVVSAQSRWCPISGIQLQLSVTGYLRHSHVNYMRF